MSIYIRFSNDIYADLKRGHSFYFRTGEKMDGLCAWSVPLAHVNMPHSEIVEECIKTAKNVLKGSYGGYSSDSEVHILVAEYVANGNDGVLIKNAELLESFTI